MMDVLTTHHNDGIPERSNLRGRGKDFFQCKVQVVLSIEVGNEASGWQPCLETQGHSLTPLQPGNWRGESSHSIWVPVSPTPFIQCRSPAHGVVLFTVRVGFLFSVKAIQKHPNRHTSDFISSVALSPVRLTKTNHHKSHCGTCLETRTSSLLHLCQVSASPGICPMVSVFHRSSLKSV